MTSRISRDSEELITRKCTHHKDDCGSQNPAHCYGSVPTLNITNWIVHRNGKHVPPEPNLVGSVSMSGLLLPAPISQRQQILQDCHRYSVRHPVGASGESRTNLGVLDGEKSDSQNPWLSAVTAPCVRPWELPRARTVHRESHFSAVEAESGFADTAPRHFPDRHQNCVWHLVGGCSRFACTILSPPITLFSLLFLCG